MKLKGNQLKTLPKTTQDYFSAIKRKFDLQTAYQVAKHYKLHPKTARNWESGKGTIDETNAVLIAHDLGIPSGYVLACMAAERAERAKRPAVADVWHDVMKKAGGFGIAAFFAVAAMFTTDGNLAAATDSANKAAGNNIHYANWLISAFDRARSILSGFRQLFALVPIASA